MTLRNKSILSFFLLCICSVNTMAVVFTVNTLENPDLLPAGNTCEVSIDGQAPVCTLTAAIHLAELNTDTDTIQFSVTGVIPTNRTYEIFNNIIINGPGPNRLTLHAVTSSPHNQPSAIFSFFSRDSSISDMKFTADADFFESLLYIRTHLVITNVLINNLNFNFTSAISNYGALVINNSTFSENTVVTTDFSAADRIGFIRNLQFNLEEPPTLIIWNSRFLNNKQITSSSQPIEIFSGAISNIDGTLEIQSSTFSNNSTDGSGGAIYSKGPTKVINSTFSGNSAVKSGGGIYFAAQNATQSHSIIINNTTIFDNNAGDSGGGLFIEQPLSAQLGNNIISGNRAGTALSDCSGNILSEGYNLFSSFNGCGGSVNAADLLFPDAGLLPLADNGGHTPTHALRPESPAINAGNPEGCKWDHDADQSSASQPIDFDQRDVARSNGDGVAAERCDIGAFERVVPSIVLSKSRLTTSEEQGGGHTDSLTIHLTTRPNSDVVIQLQGDDRYGLINNQLSQSTPVLITFTPENWQFKQTVDVSGVDDEIDQDNNYTIFVTVTSADSEYHNFPLPNISVSHLDNDGAGIIVEPGSGLITDENGRKAFFNVRLASAPVADVTLTLSTTTSATGSVEGTVEPNVVTFKNSIDTDPDYWGQNKTITVTGLADGANTGDQVYDVVISIASDDLMYSNLFERRITVTNLDVDATLNNKPPAVPELISPAQGAAGVSSTNTELRWTRVKDPDGDAVLYKLWVCKDSTFIQCDSITIEENKSTAMLKQLSLASAGLLPFLFLQFRRRKLLRVYLLLLCILPILSCSNAAREATQNRDKVVIEETDVVYTFAGLEQGQTYFWKVQAVDSKGQLAESIVWHFSTL